MTSRLGMGKSLIFFNSVYYGSLAALSGVVEVVEALHGAVLFYTAEALQSACLVHLKLSRS